MTDYKLNKKEHVNKKGLLKNFFKRIFPLLVDEKRQLIFTFIAVIISSLSSIIAPVIIAHTIDTYIKLNDYHGILVNSFILFLVYLLGTISSFVQTKTMGGVGRRLLFNLRNLIFTKLQELPITFFNQNKIGDLISRINNDTDKLNQFFSQALMQFLGNFFLILGSGIMILFLNFKLGFATLFPAFCVFLITQVISPWVKRKNLENLQSTGGMSSEIQENLNNFKVIIAFNRLDYFNKKFEESNDKNYKASIKAGIASNIFTPIYGFASNIAQLVALSYGFYLITVGNITLGILIGFQFYVNNFYSPLKQLASVWSSFQLALASIDRIYEVLDLKTDLDVIESDFVFDTDSILEFKNVNFNYSDGNEVLKNINFKLCKGKTYALVGPTGGGKTTTASLMARLYDPTSGNVLLHKKDIKSFSHKDRTDKIGFILQEPFLFTGNVRDNILYGNDEYLSFTNEQILDVLKNMGLLNLLSKFEKGLDTKVSTSGESISLGQKQLIAFIRAILKKPEVLILDEATANIDTVTEQLLDNMLNNLSKDTIKVIIAHRLNTIKNADEIFFVNAGTITCTGSMDEALELLMNGKRNS